MKSESCRRCIGFAETAEDALAILNSPPGKCADCANSAMMRTVCEQFQMRVPHWWLVDGTLAVPIWVVELVNNHLDVETQSTHDQARAAAAA